MYGKDPPTGNNPKSLQENRVNFLPESGNKKSCICLLYLYIFFVFVYILYLFIYP